MEFEKCHSCGYHPLVPSIPSLSFFSTPTIPSPKYCSKCGYTFWSECSTCNGKGHYEGEFCPSCGRKKPNIKCFSCNGSGKTVHDLHFCKKDVFPF